MTKYDFSVTEESLKSNVTRLTNQLWKLLPMKENEENWEKQAETVILELAGLNRIFYKEKRYLQLLSKLEGLYKVENNFNLYRKTIFEAISLLQELAADE